MKSRKKNLIIVLICIVLLCSSIFVFVLPKFIHEHKPVYSYYSKIIEYNSDGLKFAIEPAEEYYLIGETMWFRIIFENNSQQTVKFKSSPSLGLGLWISITGADGKGVNYNGPEACTMLYEDSISFKPGEKHSHLINLNNYPIEKTGKTLIHATYSNMTASSEIDILEPTGYDILMCNSLYDENDFKINNFNEDKIEERMELLSDYSDSKYAPDIYIKLSTTLLYQGRLDEFRFHFDNYINMYANNPSTKAMLVKYYSYLREQMLTDEEIKDRFTELTYKFPLDADLRNYVYYYIKMNSRQTWVPFKINE